MTRMREISAHLSLGLVAALTEYEGSEKYRTCFLWDKGRLVGKYRKVHPYGDYVAGGELVVLETRFGRVGMMLDDEALLPEVPRCLMLEGADVILWPAGASNWPLRTLARARADENKCYVVLATAVGCGTAIAGPSGALIAEGLPDVEQVIAAQVAWVNSRCKEMAPGTHVVRGRIPGAYHVLSEHA